MAFHNNEYTTQNLIYIPTALALYIHFDVHVYSCRLWHNVEKLTLVDLLRIEATV